MVQAFDMSGNYDRKDHLYQRAKDEGYRSRAAFKLMELDQKYHLLRPGMRVLDLGCWPGGWVQVASRKVGGHGLVVGIDLVEVEALSNSNVRIIVGDAREDENIERALAHAPQGFDVLLSDMSPKLTGIREADQAGTVACAELAFWAAERLLRKNGNFVCKVFKGNETEVFFRSIRPRFEKLVRSELKSTRKTSNEFYILGFGFTGEQTQ